MSISESDSNPLAQCEGNHNPVCPNRFYCKCKMKESTEDDAMGALLEEEREGVLDLNAVGGYGQETALILSCNRNWLRLAAMLLDKGADVNKANNYGRTPLFRSCFKDNLELARLLLDKRADVNKADDIGWTPLLSSCNENNWELVKFCWTMELMSTRQQSMTKLLLS